MPLEDDPERFFMKIEGSNEPVRIGKVQFASLAGITPDPMIFSLLLCFQRKSRRYLSCKLRSQLPDGLFSWRVIDQFFQLSILEPCMSKSGEGGFIILAHVRYNVLQPCFFNGIAYE